ncbi:MAG: Na(+)/H(+) antiporter subunit D, partial [Opitutales bacterium]|nr:Na(+)/H(+) antiporter subunit D [Opitutales bacterium]
MNNPLPPQLIILIGGLLIPLFKGKLRLVYMLALPLFAFFNYLKLEEGIYWTYSFLSFDLVLGRVDKLSLIFLNVFIVITVIAVIYNSHVKGKMEHFSGFLYAGSAMGVILAGDLITFFIFWELLTVGAAFLILVRKSSRSLGAATRYLLVHVVGGLV